MIYVKTILDENNKAVIYDSDKKSFIVPLSLTKSQFNLFDEILK